MKRVYIILLPFICLIAGWIMTGCNASTKQSPPTYVHIDSFHFKVPQTGVMVHDGSSQITEVWAYYNGNVVGAFDLPVTFPIITDGSRGSLTFAPGIMVDGLNSFLSVYPFYTYDTATLITQPGKVVTIEPTTTYDPGIKNSQLFLFGGGSGYYGAASGNLVIQSSGDTGVISLAVGDTLEDSCRRFAIDTGSAFIELDYKGNVPFYVGMGANESNIISSTPFYLTGIYPSSTWQKFYLSVADFAGQYQGTTYNLYIKAYLPPGVSSGTVYLRNIQFLSF